jgi:hypothetical protein
MGDETRLPSAHQVAPAYPTREDKQETTNNDLTVRRERIHVRIVSILCEAALISFGPVTSRNLIIHICRLA